MNDTADRPQVVIVGAGFGGLEAAKALARTPVEITLIDRHNHHCFQPLLYQVATAALSPADIAWPIRAIFRRQANVRVVLGEVGGVDTAARCVRADTLTIAYDYLVLATGVTHSYFGHDEWAPYAPGLKAIEDATEIRRRILLAFERAEVSTDEAERRKLLTFAIVGGGPTGVEMAGSIAEIALQTLQGDFRRVDPRTARIVLLEAGPRVLPSFPESLSDYARRSLERMGVEVRTGTAVTACDADGVAIGAERIDASTVIWAAGVAASPAARWLGAKHDRAGRIEVEPDLGVPGLPDVFAVGDTTYIRGAPPLPGIAPVAKQMGRYVGRLIAARVAGKPAPPAFRYRHYGDLATVGRRSALVAIGGVRLTGFFAWVFWSVAHIYFLIGVRNRLIVALNWLWNYLTLQRGARLITERVR